MVTASWNNLKLNSDWNLLEGINSGQRPAWGRTCSYEFLDIFIFLFPSVYDGGVVIAKRCFCLTLKMMAWHIGVRVIGDPLSRLPTLNILYAFYPNLYIQEDKKKNRSSDYIGLSNVIQGKYSLKCSTYSSGFLHSFSSWLQYLLLSCQLTNATE